MLSSDVIDMDEGCCITNALQEYALALHQMMLTQGVVNPSDPRCLKPSTSPGEVSGSHPSNSSLKNSLGSAGMLAPTRIENLEHINAVASQLSEGVEEQRQSGSNRFGVQEAFMDDYP